jgi:hypothetical protein
VATSAKCRAPGWDHGVWVLLSRPLTRGQEGALHQALVPQEEDTLSWRPRNCSVRPRRDPARPSVRGPGGTEQDRAGGAGRHPLTLRVPAVLCLAPPRGPGYCGRPGGAERPAQTRARPQHRADPRAACGRAAGRGDLRE